MSGFIAHRKTGAAVPASRMQELPASEDCLSQQPETNKAQGQSQQTNDQ